MNSTEFCFVTVPSLAHTSANYRTTRPHFPEHVSPILSLMKIRSAVELWARGTEYPVGACTCHTKGKMYCVQTVQTWVEAWGSVLTWTLIGPHSCISSRVWFWVGSNARTCSSEGRPWFYAPGSATKSGRLKETLSRKRGVGVHIRVFLTEGQGTSGRLHVPSAV
jgi:hypothetical protein